MERAKLDLCKYCKISGDIRKRGFSTNNLCSKIQRYECLECKKYFTPNFGFGTRTAPSTITGAMQMYFTVNVRTRYSKPL